MKYKDLNFLLQQDPEAKAYFNQLPNYVQDQIMTRSSHINSIESLQDYAENLTRGDG